MWTLPNAPKRVRAQHQLSALFSGAQSLTFADHASEGVPSDRLDLLAGELRRERRISGSELSSGGHVVSNPVHTREKVEGSRKQQSSLALAIRGGSPAASPGRPAWAHGGGSAKMRGSSPRCPTGSSCDQLSCRDEPPTACLRLYRVRSLGHRARPARASLTRPAPHMRACNPDDCSCCHFPPSLKALCSKPADEEAGSRDWVGALRRVGPVTIARRRIAAAVRSLF